MLKLFKFEHAMRDGTVEGLFIAEEGLLKLIDGKEVGFGSIFGKYSDVYFGFSFEDDIEEILVCENTLDDLLDNFGYEISGHNPLHYVEFECSKCGSSLDYSDIGEYNYHGFRGRYDVLCDKCDKLPLYDK